MEFEINRTKQNSELELNTNASYTGLHINDPQDYHHCTLISRGPKLDRCFHFELEYILQIAKEAPLSSRTFNLLKEHLIETTISTYQLFNS